MKTLCYNFFWRSRYGVLLVFSLIIGGISGYWLFLKPQIPACRAVVGMTNQREGKTIQRILLISVAPDGPRRATVLINGSLFDGATRYNVGRTVTLDYRRRGEDYIFTVVKNSIRQQDSVVRPDLNKHLPMVGQQYHLRIEQIDSSHYMFIANYGPLFVCSTRS
ncbi:MULTISPECIES: hypothetical protein [Serratia]|uniref:hypothetical protein n=1 Tax=Serratia TaxID=613 RepID=UPI00128E6143|nr:hypothetical protein [Serratia marcescens]MDT8208563.1 hypothetical protein [Serratia marcescens]